MKIYVVKMDDDDSIEIFQNATGHVDSDDIVRVVRCKDCKHRPVEDPAFNVMDQILPPKIDGKEDFTCPCLDMDSWHSWTPNDDWFCADGER